MSVLFLPATVGIMACVATVKSVLLPLIVIIAVTVVVNIFVIGRVVQFVKMRFEGDYVDSAGVVRAPTTEKETENDSSSND
jgi:holin-like protein